jgi:N-acetylglutamate synthase-like GNAT family acetyltransferase
MAADLPVREHLTPWLAAIYVATEHRGQGVAAAIVGRLVDEAHRLKLPRLYLWTSSAAGLYAKLGWKELEKLEYCGKPITVMVREF